MFLLFSIIFSAILGFILLMMGPVVGGIVAFGIVVGCMFRGLYLLNDIHKRMESKEDHVEKAYREYLEENREVDGDKSEY